MDRQEMQKVMRSGFDNLRPKLNSLTETMMDCYMQGFKDCWRVLTGQDFE